MFLSVYVDTKYGRRLVYPACEKSHALCRLQGTKTLTDREFSIATLLGYSIQFIQHPDVIKQYSVENEALAEKLNSIYGCGK